ncbi:MAG: ImmA/IrrE family metallo-endopeptidase [Deltaproteobacteria bacterium]|nr:ImmA/IrrE family metallo-endopeptidase [Deltaproteobacteria bacterium]
MSDFDNLDHFEHAFPDRLLVQHGPSDGLRFELRWAEPEPSGTAAEATRGALALWLGEQLAWGGAEGEPGFEWTWVELLEHLASSWLYLFWEQCDPLGLDVILPALRQRAAERWEDQSGERRDEEQEQLEAFLPTHDLAAGLAGAWPASLWLLREGNEMRAWTSTRALRLPHAAAMSTLAALGDAVCARLRGMSDHRALLAAQAWKRRGKHDAEQVIGVATGLEQDEIEDLAPDGSAAQWLEVSHATPDETELLAVARMTRTVLGTEDVRKALAWVRALPRAGTEALDSLSRGACAEVRGQPGETPAEKGCIAANWLRGQIGLCASRRVNVERLLTSWGVQVDDRKLGNEVVDAIAAWGPRHGPAILVNRSGVHCRGPARRATLAHEVGHLLLDRDRALPLAEVLGGRVSRDVEARARAFAAELLVPRSEAGQRVAGASNRREAERRLQGLCRQFGVSRELAAWQVRNSDVGLASSVRTYLQTLVREPWRF